MRVVLLSLAGILGALFLWGLVSPRSQWYALVGWTRSDPRETEPGPGAYGVSRIVSLVGLLALLAMAGVSLGGEIVWQRPQQERAATQAERVWGEPRSFVVDRVFTPAAAPPAGLVEQGITGFQTVDGEAGTPEYLFEAGKIRAAGLAAQPGFLGVEPLPDRVALDTADLVVHVRGDDRCIPQRVVVVPVEGAVQVGVFFGRPVPAEGDALQVGDCDAEPDASRTRGFLIPIDLAQPLGDRALQSLQATPIELVPPPAS